MNKVFLVGRVIDQPRASKVTTRVQFSVSTNPLNNEDEYELHPCLAHGGLGETVMEFVKRGELVSIIGRLHTGQWDDDGGNRHWHTQVLVENLELLGSKATA